MPDAIVFTILVKHVVYLGIQRGTQCLMYWSLRTIICFIMNACMSTTCKINGPSISHQLLNYLFSIVILVDWMTEMLGLSLWGYINFCVNLSTMHSFVPKYITYYFVYTKKNDHFPVHNLYYRWYISSNTL